MEIHSPMHRFRQVLTVLLLWLSMGAGVQAQEPAAENSRPSDEQIHFFETTIRPLLIEHCNDCHGEDTQESDLRLDTLSGMLAGGKAGPAIAPSKPQGSLLLTAVSYRDNELQMPPDGKLSDQQIKDLTRWVEMGAPHPESGSVTAPQPRSRVDLEAGREHWAFQRLQRPDVPRIAPPVVNPIDAFLNARLSEQDLQPLGPADRRVLIRRATYDLTGLPPTPAEIHAFLSDDSVDAFERVVERLLSSPHYGERWGRHWLDVARYADSNGLDENVAHGNAWRYRDYVVQALNNDKPYDEFIREQLAGDLLDSNNDLELRRERLTATGFLVLGPKVLAEVDKDKLQMDIVDEQIDTVGRSLMGLTLGCARCHDHKFDPIGADDYYALAGIFKSTRAMETLKTIAQWYENSIALAEDLDRQQAHEQLVAEKQQQIEARRETAIAKLPPPTGETVPEDPEKRLPEDVQTALKTLRDELKKLEEAAPPMPTAMGVTEGEVDDIAVHLRGSHLTLGDVVPRRFPLVLAGEEQSPLPEDQSGRLQFARWLTNANHPLTARVMVNRIWRWHFGRGLVETVDNFGLQGTPPTHPELLDWLAVQFIDSSWSIKAMHRLIMSSEAYQRQSSFSQRHAGVDTENRLYWRFEPRRLEAEIIRDALLAVSGQLDAQLGGSLLTVGNREFLFNHTSQDKASYENIRRRSLYVPVIRNHLYDVFQLFDYTDADVLNGDRDTSTIAPQALFLMNSDLVSKLTTAMAQRLMSLESTQQARLERLFVEAYGRPPTAGEMQRAVEFLAQFETLVFVADGRAADQVDGAAVQAWQALCQSVVSSSEFVYIR
jgi:cytochrome c553/mono/diheme cytochrome c family protein